MSDGMQDAAMTRQAMARELDSTRRELGAARGALTTALRIGDTLQARVDAALALATEETTDPKEALAKVEQALRGLPGS